ncbi:uncharacterized protein PAC_15668 [Phialocephala subalpina]|uniref:C2H2-type domain-containing protein n=1 Tax=Phialocephala subalpina TaxID=576137 RepID=A0A1L7XL73_9HELO|nr:uncharacterized protein PAC_15668 [Phialocephala subalpina]
MEVVTSYCKSCNSEVGRFRNSWYGIGNTYYSPVYQPLSTDGMEATGDIYEAARESQITDSLLQDMACEKCNAILGLRCEKAPDGHLLKKNQLILRFLEMSLLSEASGQKAKISILKSIPLTSKQVPSGLRRSGTNTKLSPMPSPRPRTPALSVAPTKISQKSTQGSLASTPAFDVAKFKTWAENAIHKQQEDIDRLSGTLGRIEGDMKIFREFMTDVRAELASIARLPAHDPQDDIASLRNELDELRQKVNRNGGIVSRGDLESHSKNLDVLTDDVQRISRKTDDVDIMKAELKETNSHIRSLEDIQRSMVTQKTGEVESLLQELKKARSQLSSLEDVQQSLSTRKTDEIGALRTELQDLKSQIQSLHATQQSIATPSPVPLDVLELHRTVSDKCKHKDQGEQVQEDEDLDGTSAKRRKVFFASFPSTSQITTLKSKQAHYQTPKQQPIMIDSSSPILNHRTGSGALDSQHKHQLADSSAPDPSTPQANSTTRRSQVIAASKVVVEINASMMPPNMMPLRNGTIFRTESRNELLEVSHLEAATGRKRDDYGRWITPSGKVDRRSIRNRRSDTMGPPNPVFANGLVDSGKVNGHGQGEKRSLRPRKDQSSNRPMRSIESYDGQVDDPDKENNPNADSGMSKSIIPSTLSTSDFSSMSAFSRAERENTLPPTQVNEVFDPENLPKFFKCGGCGKKFRTLQALDDHQEHSQQCEKGPSDEVPEAFKCGACGKLFKTFTGIKIHMEENTCKLTRSATPASGSSLLKCERCGRRWKNADQSDQHTCIPKKTQNITAENESVLIGKQASLTDREQLVRQTLEREMSVQ